MKIALIVVVVLLIVVLAFGGKYVGIRNDLVTKKEAVTAAWSQVDVALQRRADLIPNLVETVKGFAKHEEKAIDDVANARAALGRRQDAAGEDRRQLPARWRARPSAGGGGELSQPEGQRKFPAPAG